MAKLKIWNAGGYGVLRGDDQRARGIRDPSSVRVFACAGSRAELLRMIAAYQGLPGPDRLQVGFEGYVKSHWSEGLWGVAMDGIQPAPGIWLQYPGEAPRRVWPDDNTTDEAPR